MTHTTIRTVAVAGFAFLAGFAVSRAPAVVNAQPSAPPFAMQPAYVLDLDGLATKPPACFPGTQAAGISSAPAATVGYLIGTVAAHTHSTANEIQYVVAGSGTEVFGDKTVRFRAGSLFVIPPGTPHAGMVADKGSGPLKFLVIKVPQQKKSGDNHFLNPPSVC